MRKTITALLATAVLALAPGAAHASDTRTVTRTEPKCNEVQCHQVKIVTTYVHGQSPVQRTLRRTSPVESRSFVKDYHWSRWHLVSVS